MSLGRVDSTPPDLRFWPISDLIRPTAAEQFKALDYCDYRCNLPVHLQM
jgi:hypothetical protein